MERHNDTPLNPTERRIVLTILRDAVATESLEYFDINDIGNKDSQCTWGLCCMKPERWPQEFRTWPRRSLVKGYVYGVRPAGHCPMDRRSAEEVSPDGSGCFYHCRVFTPVVKIPNREQALALIDAEISSLPAG